MWLSMKVTYGQNLPEDRDGFRLRGGHPALDFTATLAARKRAEPRELLQTPADLDRWLLSSGLAARLPNAKEEDVRCARALREAIFAIGSGAGTHATRETLNSLAALRPARPQLNASGELILEGSVKELLATIARQAVELFGSGERERIRICEGDGCALLFLDLSRSGGRRWCSMAGCGNRAKVAAFYQRNRQGDETD